MKVVTFGEVMMRLTAPGFQKLEQATQLNITFGGSEANVAASLALLGIPSAHVTAFPDNAFGQAALQTLRKYGVDVSFIRMDGERMGLYFVETGAVSRPSKIVYDRYRSAFAEIKENSFDWDEILKEAEWFHWSGITPALSASCARECLNAVKAARKKGIFISGDVYFRSNLWKYGKTPQEILPELVSHCDLIIANEHNMQDLFGIEWKEKETFDQVAQKMMKVYPSLKKIVDTSRISVSASHNKINARLWNGKELLETAYHDITHIVDRIGGGDAFIAGLIYGWMKFKSDLKALEFGMAASALKHTIEGDVNLSTAEEITNVMQGDTSGRIKR
jgi:2-dehydro-3-deoxygluconokinase